jgi:hypothetical protein
MILIFVSLILIPIHFKQHTTKEDHFYIVHEDSCLYACAKGHPTKELTQIRLECPKQIEDELSIMREDFC